MPEAWRVNFALTTASLRIAHMSAFARKARPESAGKPLLNEIANMALRWMALPTSTRSSK
jgi:hypothetical protein